MKGWATNDQSANKKNRYNLPNRSATILALNGVSSASEKERPPSVYTDCTGPPRSGFVQPATCSVSQAHAITPDRGKRKQPLSSADSGCHEVEPKGVEPSTSALRMQESSNASDAGKQLAPTHSIVCTRVCTSKADLEQIAADLRGRLTADECRRLGEMLGSKHQGSGSN